MESGFRGKIAVVTGGSSGIGAAIVKALAAEGCTVCFCSRNGDVNNLCAAGEGRIHSTVCDLTSPEQIRSWLGNVCETFGKIDYLINNAAFDGRVDFEDADEAAFEKFIAVNLRAAFLVSRAALPGLRAGEGRAVVNLGTTNWMLGLAPFTLYSSAKSGLIGFTRALARELGRENIRVNMVSPGWIMTEKQLAEYVTEQDKTDLLRDQALPFLLHEEDVVPAVLFLLSRGARAVTGQNLIVDGGKLMQ